MHCDVCAKITIHNPTADKKGGYYCGTCCDVCMAPVSAEGGICGIDVPRDTKYCAAHELKAAALPKCFLCGFKPDLSTDRRDDGAYICSLCSKNQVTDLCAKGMGHYVVSKAKTDKECCLLSTRFDFGLRAIDDAEARFVCPKCLKQCLVCDLYTHPCKPTCPPCLASGAKPKPKPKPAPVKADADSDSDEVEIVKPTTSKKRGRSVSFTADVDDGGKNSKKAKPSAAADEPEPEYCEFKPCFDRAAKDDTFCAGHKLMGDKKKAERKAAAQAKPKAAHERVPERTCSRCNKTAQFVIGAGWCEIDKDGKLICKKCVAKAAKAAKTPEADPKPVKCDYKGCSNLATSATKSCANHQLHDLDVYADDDDAKPASKKKQNKAAAVFPEKKKAKTVKLSHDELFALGRVCCIDMCVGKITGDHKAAPTFCDYHARAGMPVLPAGTTCRVTGCKTVPEADGDALCIAHATARRGQITAAARGDLGAGAGVVVVVGPKASKAKRDKVRKAQQKDICAPERVCDCDAEFDPDRGHSHKCATVWPENVFDRMADDDSDRTDSDAEEYETHCGNCGGKLTDDQWCKACNRDDPDSGDDESDDADDKDEKLSQEEAVKDAAKDADNDPEYGALKLTEDAKNAHASLPAFIMIVCPGDAKMPTVVYSVDRSKVSVYDYQRLSTIRAYDRVSATNKAHSFDQVREYSKSDGPIFKHLFGFPAFDDFHEALAEHLEATGKCEKNDEISALAGRGKWFDCANNASLAYRSSLVVGAPVGDFSSVCFEMFTFNGFADKYAEAIAKYRAFEGRVGCARVEAFDTECEPESDE